MLNLLKIISYPFLMLFLVFNTYSVYKAGSWGLMHPKVYLWFAIGFLSYLVFKRLLRKNLNFLETFTHELTHTIVGLLFFQKIHSFQATNDIGSMIYHSGKLQNNVFIALAPYCLPIYTFAFLIIRLLVTENSLWVIELMVGLFTAFHAITIKKQIGRHQTDILNSGIFFSYLFIWTFIMLNIALILWAMRSGIDGAFIKWWQNLLYALETITE